MITIEGEQLRRLQLTELELLREVDRICRLCGIHYTIIAGTMLGAVRHGGFIPWDDDADVAMLRSEYLRFRDACRQELDTSRFYFQDHVCTPGYRWGYGKLRRKDSLFLRKDQENMPYEQGVFIDIFPLDPVPDRLAARAIVNFQCFCVRKALWARVGKGADRSLVKRAVYRWLDRIPEHTILSVYEHLIRQANKRDSEWVRILMFPTPNRQYGYRRRWYAGAEPIVFEGCVFPGVKDADEYLRFKFGTYWELPPVKARKTHPVSAFRLPE
ncbi:MAG: LicD family protein [Oscillospiraceae bacterium]|nr:LicD family protein [Oscillospiraceae bacterium]